MTAQHYIGAAAVLAIITAMGVYSGSRVKSAGDFISGGKRAGVGIVAGSILGTLVGGSSTIGTAQLAFSYGLSAWWFTLGGGLGCLVLALFFSKALYESHAATLPQIFTREYGQKAGTTATLLTALGSFLGIVSQILAGVALISAVSRLGAMWATALIVALMLVYVVFGGVWGAGYVGIAKTILLYTSVGVCGILALTLGGGIGAFKAALPAGRYFNIFARGFTTDFGAGLSLILGVLTTQAYIQAVMSAKSLRISRIGTLISAVLVPTVGVGGIFVGMYMRLNFPDIESGAALPRFIIEHLPPIAGGAVLATLLVALVGTGAGVSLGLSAMFSSDIYKVYINKNADDIKSLKINRLFIAAVLAAAAVFSGGNMGSLILSWSVLSMGLRGAVAFGPLCAALFMPGKIPPKYAVAAMLTGPVLVLIGKFTLPPRIDPLFLGVLGSIMVLLAGWIMGRKSAPADK